MKNLKPIIALLLLFFGVYLRAQTIVLSGNVGRIIETCTSGSIACCSPTTVPTPIYPVTVQANYIANGQVVALTTNASGNFTNSQPTTAIGQVTINATAGTQYIGLSTFDLVLISQHIQQTNLFLCPLTRIAADANNDGKITTADSDLIQKIILNLSTSLPIPPWRFVPRAYVLPSKFSPDPKFSDDFWNNSFADNNGLQYPFNAVLNFNGKSYTYNGTNTWMTKLDAWPFEQNTFCGTANFGFYGVGSGDVNYSGSPSAVPFAPPVEEKSMSFERVFFDRSATLRGANDRYEIKITAISTEDVYGFQLGVKFDEKSYDYEKVKPDKINLDQDDRNFNSQPEKTTKGELRTSWYTNLKKIPKGLPANKEFDVFTFNLKFKQTTVKIEESVTLSNSVLISEFSSLRNVIDPKKITLFMKIRVLSPNED